MLHRLNKAWAKILARQTNEKIMFVYSTLQELQMLTDILNTTEKESGALPSVWITHRYDIEGYLCCGIDMEMFDDILISNDIHDMMVLDYLNRHCKRKYC